MDAETLVRDYLGRLETVSASLPVERRGELLAELREHIELALAEAGSSDEATIRNVLQRLGSPDEIVAAELGRSEGPVPAATLIDAAPPTEPSRAVDTPVGGAPDATVTTFEEGTVRCAVDGERAGILRAVRDSRVVLRPRTVRVQCSAARGVGVRVADVDQPSPASTSVLCASAHTMQAQSIAASAR